MFANSTNTNSILLYLMKVIPNNRFCLTRGSITIITIVIIDSDGFRGVTWSQIEAEGSRILEDVVVGALLSVVVVDGDRTFYIRPLRCETSTAPQRGRPTPAPHKALAISSIAPRRPLRRPSHVHSRGGRRGVRHKPAGRSLVPEMQSSPARVNDQIKVVGEEGRGRKGTQTHIALEEDRGK
jgi:hypothetical protein